MWEGQTFSIASRGLWARRDDLRAVLQADVQYRPFGFQHSTDGYLGWGDKPSSVRARKMAKKLQTGFIRLEDGFLKGWGSGVDDPSVSYVIDPMGIYYNAKETSHLESIITHGIDFPHRDLPRAKACMQEIIEAKLSKYNNAPIVDLKTLGIGPKKFVVLVDQVMGDQSINGSKANSASFARMLEHAVSNHPDCDIVIKAHPASKGYAGPLLEAVKNSGVNCKIIKDRVNLWPLIENCEHFYTVSSQTGFEALMAGKPVTCFGMPFYAGWGLTTDMMDSWRNDHEQSLEQLFAAAYIEYSRYLSLHTRKPTTIENAIDELTWLTKTRRRNGSHFVTAGMSYRKQRAMEPLLKGMGHLPFHFQHPNDAIKHQHHWPKSRIAVWGQDAMIGEQPHGAPVSRVEDGFIRSVGLGAAFARPYSVVVDNSGHLHFDRRGASDLETMLNTFDVKPHQLKRARELNKRILLERVNKYMLQGETTHNLPKPEGKLRILVPGQVEGDASLRYGSPEISTNTALINRVRELYPDALIAFKEHPDVATGLRPGKADTSAADLVVTNHNIADLLEWCDRVETMTSLTGFEALIYGVPVGTHGYPFYAGWGFTTDRISDGYKRQRRELGSFFDLLYVTMYEYPIYIHPNSELPCSPESLLDVLTTIKPTRWQKLQSDLLTSIGRLRLKIKGR